MTANENIKNLIKSYQERIEKALDHWLPEAKAEPVPLHEAMRYAVLGNGKRIRPILVYASGRAFGVPCEELDGPAAAIEMIHAYSLVHDDLPAMDDDDLRRGKPTCHKAFGEATAILAGDALQALAFHALAHDARILVSAEQRLRMIDILAIASGSLGMAGGQAIDLAAVGKQLNLQQLENMHLHKTGALICSCVELGALSLQGIEQRRMDQVAEYARCIGLAFQIRDDILDIEGDTEVIGKPQGSDIARNKPTYPNLLGLDGARKAARDLHRQALASIAGFDERADVLRWLADYVISREK